MPAILDHNFLPDMGRMTARLCSIARMHLFAGHDEGAENWACIASLIETCKLNGVDPQAYFADVLAKLVNLWPASRLDDLMPWAWAAERSVNKIAA
jgi:transposase IS66-like protein